MTTRLTAERAAPQKGRTAWNKLKPREFVVTERCTRACSLSEWALPGNAFGIVHTWFEQGHNNKVIHERSVAAGFPLSEGAIGRHRGRHLVPKDQMHSVGELIKQADGEPEEQLSDLEILERLIQTGSKSLADKKVRVSPEMLMKAMELKYKLTQGNVFQGFLDAVNEAMAAEPEEGAPESPDAVADPDEQAQTAPEEVPS